MPWQPEPFNDIIKKGRDLINNNFNIIPSPIIYVCSYEEMKESVLEELRSREFSEHKINQIKKYYLHKIAGKFFKKTNQIWLLVGKGDNLETLVHELLHSIQKCEPNREKIVDYMTYKLTGISTNILVDIIKEWKEIENSYGIKKIKQQILLKKNCEEL